MAEVADIAESPPVAVSRAKRRVRIPVPPPLRTAGWVVAWFLCAPVLAFLWALPERWSVGAVAGRLAFVALCASIGVTTASLLDRRSSPRPSSQVAYVPPPRRIMPIETVHTPANLGVTRGISPYKLKQYEGKTYEELKRWQARGEDIPRDVLLDAALSELLAAKRGTR